MYYKNSNQFKGILIWLFQDEPQLKFDVQNTGFKYKSLINITKKYHSYACRGDKCIDYSKDKCVNFKSFRPENTTLTSKFAKHCKQGYASL